MELGIHGSLYKRYVDYLNLIFAALQLGVRIKDGKLIVIESCRLEDEGKSRDQVTADLVKSIANEVMPGMICMTTDVPSNYPDKHLPILDLKCSLAEVETEEEGRMWCIVHRFWKKPMASRRAILARTAFSTNKIRAICVEEAFRRMRNTSPWLEGEEKGKCLTAYSAEMRRGGHSETFREEVMAKAVKKYNNLLVNHVSGTKNMYRSREEREQEQLENGKTDKSNWYKKTGGQGITSVHVVPCTPEGSLAKQLQKIVDKLPAPNGTRVKVVEDSGVATKASVCRSDPFPRDWCGRDTCPLAGLQGCGNKCHNSNINYTYTCIVCRQKALEGGVVRDGAGTLAHPPVGGNPVVAQYRGETSRSLFVRNSEHSQAYRSRDPKGFMWDHWCSTHQAEMENPPEVSQLFQVEITGRDTDALRRILREAVKIRSVLDGEMLELKEEVEEGTEEGRVIKARLHLLNSKREWFLPTVISLGVNEL